MNASPALSVGSESTDAYDEAAARWAKSMRAAQPYIKARQTAQRKVMIANRANGRPCGIDGCKYHAHKGRLCRKHYAMVPQGDKIGLLIACLEAQMSTARSHHDRFLFELRERLAA